MLEFTKISSKDNTAVKLIHSLQSSAKSRKENRKFVLEGLRICDDAFQNGIVFDTLAFSETAYEKYYDRICQFSSVSDKKLLMSDSVFKKLSETETPQGVIAVVSIPENNADVSSQGRFIALENLSDPSNLGAVSRTAEALGVSGIIITDNSCDPYSPKSLRASMGTLLRMPLIITADIADFARNNGLRVISCVVNPSAKPITEIDFKSGDIIVIGNEANGISDKLQNSSDILTTIPMTGKSESLNASVAASIAMWEMMRK